MGAPLLLGPITLSGFEIPARVQFGGAQRIAVHRLIDGSRVVDSLGADDGEICWSGVFSGANAATRFRLIDALRLACATVPLVWDGFAYSVTIARLDASYQGPYWIPYQIACCVVQDAGAALTGLALSSGAQAGADLAEAGGYGIDTSALLTGLGADGAVPASVATVMSRNIAMTMSSAQASLEQADGALASSDFLTALPAAQQVATLPIGMSYLARAARNVTALQGGAGS